MLPFSLRRSLVHLQRLHTESLNLSGKEPGAFRLVGEFACSWKVLLLPDQKLHLAYMYSILRVWSTTYTVTNYNRQMKIGPILIRQNLGPVRSRPM